MRLRQNHAGSRKNFERTKRVRVHTLMHAQDTWLPGLHFLGIGHHKCLIRIRDSRWICHNVPLPPAQSSTEQDRL